MVLLWQTLDNFPALSQAQLSQAQLSQVDALLFAIRAAYKAFPHDFSHAPPCFSSASLRHLPGDRRAFAAVASAELDRARAKRLYPLGMIIASEQQLLRS
jgi:hypothetical protein